jgi:AcrR family transcriptional regulator
MDAAYATEGDIEERVLRSAAEYVRFACERPHEFRILVNPPEEPEALERIAELTRQQNGKLANLLREGIAAGTIRTDLDPELVSTALWASLNGLLSLAWRVDSLRVDDAELEKLLTTFVAAISDGIRR